MSRSSWSMDLPSGSRVLDAGCGVGDVAIHLASQYGLRITGIDILDFNLTEAKRRAKEKGLASLVDFQEMSYAHLGFPPEHFDGVYTMETLVHAADAERVLTEFHRVLKPSGHLVLFEYSRSPDKDLPPRAAKILRQINDRAAMPSFNRFEHGSLKSLMETVGFSNIEVEDITEHMLPMAWAFMILATIPYKVFNAMGRQKRFVNVTSAVELWRYRQFWRYNIFRAQK